jgi:predicted AlkP superfamily pyrophosphatase or phosphodiesterase
MTNTRIPVAPKDVGRLSLVLASAIEAVAGRVNPLQFKAVNSAVVVLVDGLGLANLEAFAGHAPNIMRAWRSNPQSLRSECPSTTVLGIASLATGLRSGEHGLIGYNVYRRGAESATNLLSGWEQTSEEPQDWKGYKTLSEQFPITVVSCKAYEKTGFTELTMPKATFVAEDDIFDRFARAALLSRQAGSIVYLYVPELDQAGHRFGCSSNEWLSVLEAIDAAFAAANFGANTGVAITADHGMVDVDKQDQVSVSDLAALQGVEFITAGDTRCAFIYLKSTDDFAVLISRLALELSDRAYVCTWNDLVDSGWQVRPLSNDLIPDLVIIAKSKVAFYDTRTAKPSSLKMVGHHGAISDSETRVPLIRMGF